MDIRRLSDDFSVSPQIAISDLPALWEAGFRSIICNRPDHEDAGQPLVADVEAAARAIGFEFAHISVGAGGVSMSHVTETRQVLSDLPKPVFAYCRSGTRCTMIWSLMMVSELGTNEVLAAAAAAGYNMSSLIAAG
ncbi:hypothetical protein JI58_05850 [Marinosulfonomonas sp. PRT-SC04]|nr:hypothetical protein JI58_05850 [Marinosulfonomonas sp. PRT-SC04]